MSFGATFTVDKIKYKTLTDSTVVVTGFTLSMTDVVIPSKVIYADVEYEVKEIAERGLNGYKSGTSSSMESLTIEEGIEKIGKEGILNNKKLQKVSLPSTLVEIGERSFCNSTGLLSVEFPNGSNLLVIGDEAFRGCKYLENFEIPSSVQTIGKYGFFYCEKLFSVTIPQNVTIIQECAFQGCKNLYTVELHENIKRVERCAFEGCSSLENIDSKVIENLEYIGISAFSGIPGIKHLTLNGDLGIVDGFSSCKNLEYVWLREGITTISKMAFINCKKLKYIVLPSTLEKVESGAFGESNERFLDYVPHNPRTFILLADRPFPIEYSATTDGLNDAFPSLGKIVEGDRFYVKASTVNQYKNKWGSGYYQNIDYKIPFDSEYNYATNYREFDTDFSVTANSGNRPFVAVGYGNDYVLFDSIDNNIIPAETGIVIRKNSSNDTWFQIAEEQSHTYEGINYLKGVTYSEYITPKTNNGDINFVLNNNNGLFCTLNNIEYLGDHNAYLQLPSSSTNDDKKLIFDGNTTNIDSYSIDHKQNNYIYNLNGIKVKSPKNGIFIINNKKVLIKR